MIGYRIKRPNAGGTWMFAGTSIEEVLETIRPELELNFEGNSTSLDLSQHEPLLIEPVEITQEEIDSMPEFPGW